MDENKETNGQNKAKSGRLEDGFMVDGRYKILGFIGAGGFAKVYRAYHENMQREVALKVMEPSEDETFVTRFKREATIAGNIHHPNIVTIYDCGEIPETGQPYIAMELLKGHDLEDELKKKGPLSPHRMFALVRPVLDALGEGHAQGIVHKYLKPANLFMSDPDGDHEHVKVVDFGVARKKTEAKMTTSGQMMGTVLYLAPEYINNSENVSPAIDVYQMALIISELLTGKTAVEGETYTALMKHCMGEIELADFLKQGAAAEVFRKATCVRPEMRYKDCAEFGAALDEIADYFSSDVPLAGGDPQRVSAVSEKMSGGTRAVTAGTVANIAEDIIAPSSYETASSKIEASGANTTSSNAEAADAVQAPAAVTAAVDAPQKEIVKEIIIKEKSSVFSKVLIGILSVIGLLTLIIVLLAMLVGDPQESDNSNVNSSEGASAAPAANADTAVNNNDKDTADKPAANADEAQKADAAPQKVTYKVLNEKEIAVADKAGSPDDPAFKKWLDATMDKALNDENLDERKMMKEVVAHLGQLFKAADANNLDAIFIVCDHYINIRDNDRAVFWAEYGQKVACKSKSEKEMCDLFNAILSDDDE